MKITLHYKGFIKIEKYKSGSVIEVPDNCSVRELISLLKISNKQQPPYVLINDEPAWDSTEIKEKDSVKLIVLVAGG